MTAAGRTTAPSVAVLLPPTDPSWRRSIPGDTFGTLRRREACTQLCRNLDPAKLQDEA